MSNKNKPGRKPFGKGKTLFGNRGHGGDDDEDFDNGSDNNDDDDRSTTKKPVRRRDRTTGKMDQNPGGPDDDPESGNDDDDDDDTGGRTSKDPKLRRSGKVKRSDIEAINDEDPVDSNDDEEEGISEDPEKAAEQIQKSFAAAGIRAPSKLRLKKPKGDISGEPVEEEANAEFIGQVAKAIDDVDVKIQNIVNKLVPGADAARRRNAIFLNDQNAIKEFGEAAATVKNDASLNAALAKAGMKVGGFTVSVLAVIGGIALISAGSFLTIVSQAGGPVKIAAAISEQVIKGAETLNNKIDRKLDAAALKKANAMQLMRLLGTTEKDAAEKGTIDQTSVATFNRFRLMVAANMKENEAGDTGEVGSDEP
ncbi:hypothetical protein BKA56DRAFT_584178 [Ilyonectria sp. MPI-CAGE-AT-0026]|nr:hypothetical protein BKA56DRAFT_584178 [Ilyonectria sp. MPI-CAGE-AT-0026]